MNWFKNLQIRKKIIYSTLMIALFAAIIGFWGLKGIINISAAQDDLYTNRLLAISELTTVQSSILTIRGDIRASASQTIPEEREKYFQNINKQSTEAKQAWDLYTATKLTSTEEKYVKIYNENWNNFKIDLENVIQFLRNNQLDEAMAIINSSATAHMIKVREAVDELVKENVSQAEILNIETDSEAKSSKLIVIIFLLIGVSVAVGLGFFVANIINKPILKLSEAIKRIAAGDLNVQVVNDNKDEVGELTRAFNLMSEKISLLIQYVEYIPNPVMAIDTDYNIQYMNKSGANLLNKTQKQLIGQKCYDNFKTNDCKTENCNLFKAMKNDNVFGSETIARPNGVELPVQYTGAPLKNGEGKIIGAIESVNNIKDMKDIQNYLTRSTQGLMAAMEQFSVGDLTVKVVAEKEDDDIGRLYLGFNKSVENIRNMTGKISEAIQATASASTQISSSAEEMAAGAQEQSAQTTEIASAVEEMTKTVIETSRNASMAADNSKKASESANKGALKVEETKTGMQKIVAASMETGEIITSLSQKTDQIGEIAQVIDDIADQTNLLALNAAIEAARAGEQGRGFAVVADEVRKLAERTTKATKEIAETIKSIQNEAKEADKSMEVAKDSVMDGMKLTEQVAEVLSEILSVNSIAADMINQVAAASEEQSATAEQISRNIDGISSVTQESATGVQQIARASEDLNQLTNNLQNLIEQFKLDDNGVKSFGASKNRMLR